MPTGKPLLHFYPLRGIISQKIATPVFALARNDIVAGEIIMTKILFVCHGNICRSPMAEFVMKDLVRKAGLSNQFHIASAAASREELGNPVYPPARQELARHGLSCDGKRARQITAVDLTEYDYIYYMDSRNLRYLKQMFPQYDRFLPFLNRDVADPYYCGNFNQTWADICEGCEKILEELR